MEKEIIIFHIEVNGRIKEIGGEDCEIRIPEDHLPSYRMDLWAEECSQKGIPFHPHDADQKVLFRYHPLKTQKHE